jgi:hypothetical protein
MTSVHSFAHHYLRHRFTVLFAMLLFAIAGHGIIGNVLPIGNPLDWLMGLGLVAVVFSVESPRLRWLLGGLVAVSIAARLTQGMVEHPATFVVSQSLVIAACAVGTGVAVHRAFSPGPVDAERICAALAAYLLAGIAFGVVYWLMERTLPGSFPSAANQTFTPARAIYFSLVTQATIGFGDIVPLSEESQGIVVAQGIGGQMYLAVLVARLVSLYSVEEAEETH